jgi:hypothetical protein
MRYLTFLLPCSLIASLALAQLQAETLGVESLNNSKSMVVGNLQQPGGIKVRVVSTYVGEPAAYPFKLTTYIQCAANRPMKPMDIAGVIAEKYPSDFTASHLGAPNRQFPHGVVQVCALENVNYDRQKIFISIFQPGSETCDRSSVVDLMFAISEFCER